LGDQPTERAAWRTRRYKIGDLILRRYRVAGELGQGGMGVVYKCLDQVGGIEVALKALPPELSHNTVEMEEVRENFQMVEKLHHPHIAAVKTLERDEENGDYYLILELVEGVDLRRLRKQKGGRLTVEEVLPILRQAAEALDYAHSQKIIHRDVKPSNIMVRTDGSVKVLDFGLAAQIQTSMSRVSQVHYGTSGTGPYMAPEQWCGQYQDAATDQYALAVMAYELLAGRLPFESQDPVVLKHAVLDNPPPPLEGIGPPIWPPLARGLAKARGERYGSCAELVDALASGGRSRSNEAQTSMPRASGARKSETAERKAKAPLLIGAVMVFVLLGLAGWYYGRHRP
jgi:serine/threonine protein kinase